ncbi:NPCBM/NEW2 domain-containing protein [Alienimonas sp. DA493]|uniref:NPCBM/NEW2 domain-containing protein n=1 Tax=Alienimonas sp. DA493 TaxID=3373605 RepID=UPI003754EE8C
MTSRPLPRRTVLQGAAVACGFAGTTAVGATRAESVAIRLADGSEATGSRLWAEGATLRLDDRPLPWGDVLNATVAGPVAGDAEPSGDRGWVELTGGDRLIGTPTTFDGDAIGLERPDGTTLSLPADRVRGMRFPGAGADVGPLTKPHRLALLRDRGADDLALRSAGGRVGGELLGFDESAVRLLTAAGEIALPRADLAGLALTPDLQTPPETPAAFLSVLLADGSHLTAAELSFDETGGTAVTAAGIEVPLAAGAVRGLSAFAPTVRDAGEPSVTFAAGPAGNPPPVRNRTVTGRRAVAAGRPRPRGWGVWSGTTLTVPVPPGATAFDVNLALAAAAGELAEADAQIAVDDAVQWERSGLRAGDLVPIRVDVTNAINVSLTVLPGTLGGVQDEAFWIAPRFIIPAP